MAKNTNDSFFACIDAMFDNNKWAEYTNAQKLKHYFMINRYMSIHWPIQAAYLGRYKINGAEVVDFWKKIISSAFDRTPTWMYVKGKKKTDELKSKSKYIPSQEAINLYCKSYSCSLKDIEEMKKRFPEEFLQELKKFDEIIEFKISSEK